jgi:hypothetical protein
VILGVDHIAVAGTDLARDRMQLEALGFSCRFACPQAANNQAKIPLLARWERLHDLAVFDGGDGTALELTVHGQSLVHSQHLGFVPLIRHDLGNGKTGPAPMEMKEIGAVIRDAVGVDACWQPITGLRSGYWRTAGAGPEILAAIHIVANLDASNACLSDGMRFQRGARGRSGEVAWQLLHVAAPVPRWRLKLILAELPDGGKFNPLTLDCAGFPCLALLTTNLKADMAMLNARHDIGLAIDFVSHVNGKDLRIGMVRALSGEIIELIEVQRTS